MVQSATCRNSGHVVRVKASVKEVYCVLQECPPFCQCWMLWRGRFVIEEIGVNGLNKFRPRCPFLDSCNVCAESSVCASLQWVSLLGGIVLLCKAAVSSITPLPKMAACSMSASMSEFAANIGNFPERKNNNTVPADHISTAKSRQRLHDGIHVILTWSLCSAFEQNLRCTKPTCACAICLGRRPKWDEDEGLRAMWQYETCLVSSVGQPT